MAHHAAGLQGARLCKIAPITVTRRLTQACAVPDPSVATAVPIAISKPHAVTFLMPILPRHSEIVRINELAAQVHLNIPSITAASVPSCSIARRSSTRRCPTPHGLMLHEAESDERHPVRLEHAPLSHLH